MEAPIINNRYVAINNIISKSVNNDTKDEILEDDDNDTEKEGEVIDHSEREQTLLE